MDSAFWVVKSSEMFAILSGSGNECLLWSTRAGSGSSHTNIIIYSLHGFIVSAKGLLIYKSDETT